MIVQGAGTYGSEDTTENEMIGYYVNDDLPRFHMWMEGTGSYAKLDTRGDESGYQRCV